MGVLEERLNGTVTVAPAGELDIATVPALERDLNRLCGGAGRLVLDLSRLEFMDSAGVHMLERLRGRLGPDRLVIRPPHGPAGRALELAGSATRTRW